MSTTVQAVRPRFDAKSVKLALRSYPAARMTRDEIASVTRRLNVFVWHEYDMPATKYLGRTIRVEVCDAQSPIVPVIKEVVIFELDLPRGLWHLFPNTDRWRFFRIGGDLNVNDEIQFGPAFVWDPQNPQHVAQYNAFRNEEHHHW